MHVRDAFVLDFGIRAYCNHLVPYEGRTARAGDRLTGTVSLAVDPFFYFEQLALKPGMPRLIYSWNVNEVQLDTTPRLLIDKHDPHFPSYLPDGAGPIARPDLARESWRTLDRTRMSDDVPGGAALYRLRALCTGEEPSRTRRPGPGS